MPRAWQSRVTVGSSMRRVEQTSLVPQDTPTVHLVLDDLMPLGKVYRETDQAEADRETVINNFMSGQFYKPLRVVAFNLGEGWVSDVSEDIAREIIARAHTEDADLPEATRGFTRFHGRDQPESARGAGVPESRRRAGGYRR